MRIKLPSVNSPRRPIAFKYDPSKEKVYFIFPERTEVFLLESNDRPLFWHKYCRECSLLYLGLCSGGDPTPRPLVSNLYNSHCYKGYRIQATTVPVVVNLTNHVLSFTKSPSNALLEEKLFFLAEDNGVSYLHPYLVGNVDLSGNLCTSAKMGNNLDLFLGRLFASKWNGDYAYWLDFADSNRYSFDTHANWLKNIKYQEILESGGPKLLFSLDGAYLIEDEEYIEFG